MSIGNVASERLELGFAATLTAVLGVLMALALTYGPTSRLVPLVVGVPTLLALALVTLSLVWAPATGLVERFNTTPISVESDLFEGEKTTYVGRPVARALAWVLGLTLTAFLLGFVVVIPFFVYAYLTREGGHGRRRSATIGVVTALVISGLFELVFSTPLYAGAIPNLLLELFVG